MSNNTPGTAAAVLAYIAVLGITGCSRDRVYCHKNASTYVYIFFNRAVACWSACTRVQCIRQPWASTDNQVLGVRVHSVLPFFCRRKPAAMGLASVAICIWPTRGRGQEF